MAACVEFLEDVVLLKRLRSLHGLWGEGSRVFSEKDLGRPVWHVPKQGMAVAVELARQCSCDLGTK